MKIKKSEVKRALRVAFNAEQNTFAELFTGVDLPFWYDGCRYSVPFKLKKGEPVDGEYGAFNRLVDKAAAHIKAVEEKRKAAQ